jgi:hypothetical protein
MKRSRAILPVISTAENGENGLASTRTIYDYRDQMGRSVWHKDAAGSVSYTKYQKYVSSVKEQWSDVDTSVFPPPNINFANTYGTMPAWSGYTPRHIVTKYTVDSVGRVASVTDPNNLTRRYLYARLKGGEEATLTFPHLDSSGAVLPAGSMAVSVRNQGGPVRESADVELPASVTPATIGNVWDSTASNVPTAVITGVVRSRSGYMYTNGLLTSTNRYITADDPQSAFYSTAYDYDQYGNRNYFLDASGTLTMYRRCSWGQIWGT